MRVLGLIIATFILVGCGASNSSQSAPTKLRMAFLPSDDGKARVTYYDTVRDGIEKAVGMPVELVKVTDYSGVIEALRNKKAEIGFFGPLSYVLAKRETGAEAFAGAVGKADSDGTYHSIITVRSDSPYHSLADLRGKRIALVDPASTSGSLMPHYMVSEQFHTSLEDYFGKVVYAGTHPTAMKALVSRSVDVAAVEEGLQALMEKGGQIPIGSVREIARSQALPPSPWAFRKDLPQPLKDKIRTAILGLKNLKSTADAVGADHFRAVSDKEYVIVEELVDKLKVQREAVLKK